MTTFKAGDKVWFNGKHPGTVTATQETAGKEWMGGMIEVRGQSGVVCIDQSAARLRKAA